MWDFFKAKDEQLLINIEQSYVDLYLSYVATNQIITLRLQCCGYAHPEDRPALMTLLDNSPIITCPTATGCKDVIIDYFYHWQTWIVVGIVVLVTIKVHVYHPLLADICTTDK